MDFFTTFLKKSLVKISPDKVCRGNGSKIHSFLLIPSIDPPHTKRRRLDQQYHYRGRELHKNKHVVFLSQFSLYKEGSPFSNRWTKTKICKISYFVIPLTNFYKKHVCSSATHFLEFVKNLATSLNFFAELNRW